MAAQYPGDVALVYRHWPLTNHRFAYPAARAAECAGAQGDFETYHRTLFANQKLLGLKSFAEFAAQSGVKDLPRFEQCTRDSTLVPAIEADTKEIARLGGTGTPTLVVNGWLLKTGVNPKTLDSVAHSLLGAK